jgi:hypothetical protein
MVETPANFLSGFEKRHGLGFHRHIGACAWVAANPRLTMLDRDPRIHRACMADAYFVRRTPKISQVNGGVSS